MYYTHYYFLCTLLTWCIHNDKRHVLECPRTEACWYVPGHTSIGVFWSALGGIGIYWDVLKCTVLGPIRSYCSVLRRKGTYLDVLECS